MVPLAYQPSYAVKAIQVPMKARVTIVVGGDGEPYVTQNDYENR